MILVGVVAAASAVSHWRDYLRCIGYCVQLVSNIYKVMHVKYILPSLTHSTWLQSYWIICVLKPTILFFLLFIRMCTTE